MNHEIEREKDYGKDCRNYSEMQSAECEDMGYSSIGKRLLRIGVNHIAVSCDYSFHESLGGRGETRFPYRGFDAVAGSCGGRNHACGLTMGRHFVFTGTYRIKDSVFAHAFGISLTVEKGQAAYFFKPGRQGD